MAWPYNPKDARECLPEGEYDAEITTVAEKTSKAGNPMLEVTLSAMQNGRPWPVREYIVNPATLYKLKQIARALGCLQEFEEGRFDLQDHVGRVVKVVLSVEVQPGYQDKNQVKSYREASFVPVGSTKPSGNDQSDDIPF